MNRKKARALEADGWRIGTVQELLTLSGEEMAYIDIKVALAEALREKRGKKRLTQQALADLLGSSQPRVASIEKGEGTLDILVRALLALGTSPKEIARRFAAANTG